MQVGGMCLHAVQQRNKRFFLTYCSPVILSAHCHRVATCLNYKCAQLLQNIDLFCKIVIKCLIHILQTIDLTSVFDMSLGFFSVVTKFPELK